MQSAAAIRKVHREVCEKMAELMHKGELVEYSREPLPKDKELYFRLESIKLTLEWVYPSLVARAERGNHRHLSAGPLHAELYP
jgi:hypothetical protein